jgi:hypothetical protein
MRVAPEKVSTILEFVISSKSSLRNRTNYACQVEEILNEYLFPSLCTLEFHEAMWSRR